MVDQFRLWCRLWLWSVFMTHQCVVLETQLTNEFLRR